MKSIHVIILNWNGEDDTIECINSLIKQVGVKLNIIVIDNGSKEQSIKKIKNKFPYLKIIENKKNLGFSGGMNIGIKVALRNEAEYILLINNDTVAEPNLVKNLLANIQGDIGIAGPIIYYYQDPNRIWSVGGKIHPIFTELFIKLEKEKQIPKKPEKRDFITGCAMLIKREVFEKVGVFDERFNPAYYEDLDFCLRVKKAGYKIIVDPNSILWHKVSQSSKEIESENLIFLVARNSGIYFRKNLKLWNFLPIILYRLISAVKRTIVWSIRKKIPLIKAYWCGLFVGWTGISKKCQKNYMDFYTKSTQ